ncbi:hypothetical protein [Chitinophaga skermanii]|nr:hypothetical protein [Chitinophaga skermanii]
MKILKLHPLMTISLLQMQFQRLLHCNVAVYARYSLANSHDTLKEVGLLELELIEHPIDETLSVREFEEELEEKYNCTLELCDKNWKPFTNKSLRLFQLLAVNNTREEDYNRSLEFPYDLFMRNFPHGSQANPAI